MKSDHKIPAEPCRHDALKELHRLTLEWCKFLDSKQFQNFSDGFRLALNKLNSAFDIQDRGAIRDSLLNFGDRFKGGMGSINDLPIDDSKLRAPVEVEYDKVLRKFW